MDNKAIGKPILRKEDNRRLTGKGQFSDDFNLPNQAHAVFLRSPHAYAKIKSIDATNALEMNGVLGFFTGQDWLDDGLAPIPHSPVPSGGDGLGMDEKNMVEDFSRDQFSTSP